MEPKTFEEYYDYYMSLHQNKVNRRLHVAGQAVTVLFVLYSLFTSWWLLLLAPFVVYPFAWSGHFFVEKNEPAAFTNPLWAKASDWVMLRDWVTGRIER
jgi:hypothetical protein